MKKPTIHEIAKQANVSIATVSMVLSGRDQRISSATRKKVLEAAKFLNFEQIDSSDNIIGLLLPTYSSPYYSMIACGIGTAVNANGYRLITCYLDGHPQQELDYVKLLIKKQAKGIIITEQLSDESYRFIHDQQQNLKVVSLVSKPKQTLLPQADLLRVDGLRGANLVVDHLWELGHRKLAYIGQEIKRFQFFEQCLAGKPGFDVEKDLITVVENRIHKISGEDVMDTGYTLTQRLLQTHPEVTAIFAFNDLTAFGAITAIKETGLRIPADISIVGYDDLPFSAITDPPLTTIEQPKLERGKDAAEYLIERIEGRRKEPIERVYFPRLIVRKSTGPVQRG